MTSWAVKIDWNKDGDFSDLDENIWGDVIALTWKLGMGRAFQSLADESTCQITLRNEAGKYNPENPSSPLAGKLLPQCPVQILADGVSLWRGWTERITPRWAPAAAQTGRTTAVIYCVGAKQFLQEAEVNLPLQANKRGDEIIAEVLRRVVLPPATLGGWILGKVGFSELGVSTRLASESDYSTLDEGSIIFGYYGDVREAEQSTGSNGYRIIRDITEAERGRFFFDRDGKAVWWNRHRLLDDASVDDVVDSSGGVRPVEVDYQHGVALANRVMVTAYPRKPGAGSITLWSLDKPLTIAPGQSISFEAPFVDENKKRAGALSASTSGITFDTGTAEVTLTPQAERAQVSVTNNGAVPAVMSALEVVGQVLTSHNRMVALVEDPVSVRLYGRRGELKLNLRALDDYSEALEIADFELRRRKDPRGAVQSIGLLNPADGSANAEQLSWQIGTRLRVVLSELGHDLPYFIIGEEHQVTAGGKVHQTTFILEPAILTRLAYYWKTHYDTDVNLKSSDGKTRLAQSCEVSVTGLVGSVRLWLRKVGSPTGNLTLKIFSNHLQGGTWLLGKVGSSELGTTTRLAADADYPDSLLTNGTSQTVAAAKLGAAYGWVEFRFSTPPSLNAGTSYWLVLESSDSPSGSNYVQWGADGAAPAYADGQMLSEQGGSWKLEHKDAVFEVYAP